jgi:hypothetical protein
VALAGAILGGFLALGLSVFSGAFFRPLDRALSWLLSTQEPGGGWSPAKWGGEPEYQVGVSGLIVMALSDAGTSGTKEAAGRGARFLLDSQMPSGLFGPEFRGALYNHAIATLALLEAQRGTPDPRWGDAIERALRYLLRCQSPSGGWGYLEGGEVVDSGSITIWPLQALVLARARGFEDLTEAIERSMGWIERHAGKEGIRSLTPGAGRDHFCGADSGLTLRALGTMLVRDASARPARQTMDELAKSILTRRLPADFYQSYFLSHVLHAADVPALRGWREEKKRELISAQVVQGPLAGSWEPVDRWSPTGSRLCTTALAVLTLEAETRVRRFLGTRSYY